MEVRHTTLEHIKVLFNSSDEVYPMTSPRGRVFIVNNDEFDEAANRDQSYLHYRAGSEVDLEALQNTFEALNFVVVPISDLSSQHLLNSIEQETTHPDHEKYGMFVMVILSHGDQGVVYGSDSRKVSIKDITRRLSIRNFPAMANKPKIVIVQACSGGGNDSTVYRLQTDNPEQESPGPSTDRVVTPPIPDFVLMQASYPGFRSYRDPCNGTFMIQAFTDVLRDFSCHENVPELIVKVRSRVLKMCEEFNDDAIGHQTVHCSETLRRKLYFFPGLSGPNTLDSISASAQPPQACPTGQFHRSASAEVPTSRRSPTRRAASTGDQPLARGAASPSTTLNSEAVSTSSAGLAKLYSLKMTSHMDTISTPNYCHTVQLDLVDQVLHGGYRYDSLNGTRDGVNIDCIRAAPENQLMQLESNCRAYTAHIVTYQLAEKQTPWQKMVSMITYYWNAPHKRINKIQVHKSDQITQFTKIGDVIIQTGANSGKLYIYQYSTGELTRELTHADMKWPRGICHDTNTSLYVTDWMADSIFTITLKDDELPLITKLGCTIPDPVAIAFHEGRLVVLSAVEPVPNLYIMTTEGKKVTTIELPKCEGKYVLDLSINARGIVVIANRHNGVQLYQSAETWTEISKIENYEFGHRYFYI